MVWKESLSRIKRPLSRKVKKEVDNVMGESLVISPSKEDAAVDLKDPVDRAECPDDVTVMPCCREEGCSTIIELLRPR